MPRFFFHVRDRNLTIFDTEGSELPDLDVALVAAAANAREIIADGWQHGRIEPDRWFEIVDDSGVVLAEVHFRDFLGGDTAPPISP
jgi:hypothetical protein